MNSPLCYVAVIIRHSTYHACKDAGCIYIYQLSETGITLHSGRAAISIRLRTAARIANSGTLVATETCQEYNVGVCPLLKLIIWEFITMIGMASEIHQWEITIQTGVCSLEF